MNLEKINSTVEEFYKNTLNEKDIEVLSSLKSETVTLEGNFYVSNLKSMGFSIENDSRDIEFAGENLKTYSGQYIKIKKDNKYGIASLHSSEILVLPEYDNIKKCNIFRFKALDLQKGENKYIYNIEKKVLMAKFKADKILECIDDKNIIISTQEKIGIFDIVKNAYLVEPEYDDVLYFDERLIAMKKDNIITVINYINAKIILEYKASSEDYFIDYNENSSFNAFIINKNNKVGLIDIFSGEILIDPEYDKINFVYCFGKDNIALLEKDNQFGLYNVLDKNMILNCIFDEVILAREKLKKYIFIFEKNGKRGFCTEKEVIANNIFNSIEVSDDKATYIVCKTNEKAYIYNQRKQLFSLDNNDEFKYIYKDKKKGFFVGTKFGDNKYLCIHENERSILSDKITDYKIKYVLNDNKGYVLLENKKFAVIYLDVLDSNDNFLKRNYSEVSSLNDNLFCIKNNDLYGIMDSYGNVIQECIYESIKINDSNIIECRLNGLIGYFDQNAKKVSKCVYDEISIFDQNNNIYLVRKQGKYGLIKYNMTILPFDFEKITLLSTDMFDTIKQKFSHIYSNEVPKYLVREKGKYAILNEKGFVMSDYIYMEI